MSWHASTRVVHRKGQFKEMDFGRGQSVILLICYVSYSQQVFMYIIQLSYFNGLAIIMDV